MDKLAEKVLACIKRADLIDLTARLVALPTENPPADYTHISQFMTQLYKSIGLEVHTFSGADDKPNVGGRWQGTGEKNDILMLSGHMDVVPAGTGWKTDPFQAVVQDNYLLGRGTVDMKGSLAAQFLAVKALKDAGVQLKGDLYLFSTVDDETAGKMGLHYIVQDGWKKFNWAKPTFHILGEPTNLKLCVAFKGRIWIRITVKGRSAHGGNPSAGINAIEKMTRLLPQFVNIERQSYPLMGTDTINIGTIRGGEKTNIVPDECSTTIDYRFVKPQTSEDIEANLKNIIAHAIEQDPEIEIKEFTVFERREPQEISKDNHYLQSLKMLTEKTTGKETCFDGMLSAGDSYWTILDNIPVVYYGPGAVSVMHTNKECINIDELKNAASIFALYALQILG